jgi:DNA-binding response OmpR family regulator
VSLDPTRCRLLLVGKLMGRFAPFLASRGYAAESTESGAEAVGWLGEKSYHLILHELNLKDMELREFYQEALPKQSDAAYLVLAPPVEAESVISCLVLGADGYIPLPPDEDELFRVLERHGLAALQRKSAAPDAQPGEGTKSKLLQAQLESVKDKAKYLLEQVAALEHDKSALETRAAEAEATAERLKKQKSDAPPLLPAGSEVVSATEIEELRAKASFTEFLESENDQLKEELARQQELGGKLKDDSADSFDEPTIFNALLGDAPAAKPAPASAGLFLDEAGGDDDELLVLGDDDELVTSLNDEEELREEDLELEIEEDLEEELELERPRPAPAPVVRASSPAPRFEDAPPATDPFAALLGSSEKKDEFEDTSTDDWLRLADSDLAGSAEGGNVSDEDLAALLAEIDED